MIPSLVKQALEFLIHASGSNKWTIRNNKAVKHLISFDAGAKYKCPICKSSHDSDGIYAVFSKG